MAVQPSITLRSGTPIYAVLTGVLAVVVGWWAWRQQQIEARIAELQLTVDTVADGLQEGLLKFQGDMPAEWQTRLAELEKQTLDASGWPANAQAAATFNDAVSHLVKELPTVAEARYLPRLNAVRWSAMTFSALRSEFPRTGIELATHSDDLYHLIAAAPVDVPEVLLRLANETAAQWSAEALDLERAACIQEAQKALQDPTAIPALLDVIEGLEQFADSADSTSEAAVLLAQLRTRILVTQAEHQSAGLLDRWAKLQALKTSDASMFEQATSGLHAEVAAARLNHFLERVPQKSLEVLDQELRGVVRELQLAALEREGEQQADAVRRLQRWALEQIEAFEKEFEDAKQQADTNATLGGLAGASWTDAEYESLRDAMVEHLLTISTLLLDPPVYERYQRAFQSGWEQLDGRDEQTFVAEQCAVAVKKSLRDFAEDSP